MADGPQVYRTEKVESLEYYRKRFEEAGPKERKKMAMLEARAMHQLLTDLTEEIRALRKDVNELVKRASK